MTSSPDSSARHTTTKWRRPHHQRRLSRRLFLVLATLLCCALTAQIQPASAQQIEPRSGDTDLAVEDPLPPPRPGDEELDTRVVVEPSWQPSFLDDKYSEQTSSDPDEGMPWQGMNTGGGGGGWGPPASPETTSTTPTTYTVELPQPVQDELIENGFPNLATTSWYAQDDDSEPPPWNSADQQLLDNAGIGFLEYFEGWQPVPDTGDPDIEAWALFSEPREERKVVLWFDRRCECGPSVLVSVEDSFVMGDAIPNPWANQQIDRRFTLNFGPIGTDGPDGTIIEPGQGYFEDSRWPNAHWEFSEAELLLLLDGTQYGYTRDLIDTLLGGATELNIMLYLNRFEWYLEDQGLMPTGFVPAPSPAAPEFADWEPVVHYEQNLKFIYNVNAASGAHGLQISTPSSNVDNAVSLSILLDDGQGAGGTAQLEYSSATFGNFEVELNLFTDQWQGLTSEFPSESTGKLMRAFFMNQVDLIIDGLIDDQVILAQDVQEDPYPTLDMFASNPSPLWAAVPEGMRNWGLDWSPSLDGAHTEVQDSQGNTRFMYFDQSNALYYTDDLVPPWVVWMTANTWVQTPDYTTHNGLGEEIFNSWEPDNAPLLYLSPMDWPELNTGTGVTSEGLAAIVEFRYG